MNADGAVSQKVEVYFRVSYQDKELLMLGINFRQSYFCTRGLNNLLLITVNLGYSKTYPFVRNSKQVQADCAKTPQVILKVLVQAVSGV